MTEALLRISFKDSSDIEPKETKPAIDPVSERQRVLYKKARLWLKREGWWMDSGRDVLLCNREEGFKSEGGSLILSQWGAMGRQDLTPVPLAKVTAFSSGLFNTLQAILYTHRHAYTLLSGHWGIFF